uniref:Uncharacterized protein n=1 Tax=viral metagenome TaxID=1070528 RepID=A0A6C0KS03_9ZZZZ
MSSSGITSINELPLLNNQNGHIQQQQMMSQQPQNVVLNRNEIVSTNNNQMTTSSYTQLLPSSGGSTMNNPITMENSNQSQAPPNYNELISQLQKAAAYGTTALPSRDIPMEPLKVANDVQSQPNYIPPPQFQEDYIKNSITPQNLVDTNSKQIKNSAYYEKLYGELQLPVIIALLFFLFQLPLVKQYNKKLLPFLFKSDGNPNLYGYIANSVLFASMIYVLLKLVAYLA